MFDSRPPDPGLRASTADPDPAAYAELHAHSGFSFLDGASDPEELVAEACRLGLTGLALTDHHGFYGVVRFAEAARALGLPTVFGAELSLAPAGPRTGDPDPAGRHLVVLARDPQGYARLSTAMADAHLAGGEKGRPVFDLDDLAARHGGHWLVLTGCRKGAVPAALVDHGPAAARRELDRLLRAFGGRDHVAVELWDHGHPLDSARNDALALLAGELGVDVVATNNVHYATPAAYRLATTLSAVRARRPLADLDGWLPPAPAACLRSGPEQARRFARWPGAVPRAAALAAACAFDLRLVAPRLPDFPVPPGLTEHQYLVQLVTEGATDRYGPRAAERVPGAWAQLDHELSVIDQLGFAGYFLVVWDICRESRARDIYCQGRGSAANSAVCYALRITDVDAVSLGLLFERFLSPARDGPPDIDVDFESSRREELIQYVYDRHGRRHAAQVANVITYRPRSAIRDVGKALGYPVDQVDAWASGVDHGRYRGDEALALAEAHDSAAAPAGGGAPSADPAADGGAAPVRAPGPSVPAAAPGLPPLLVELATEVLDRPRHLGIHSAGMVICDRPVVEVCPVEWGRMPGRTVLHWDKDDCAAIGLVKFDLLGLGMLEALHRTVDLVRDAGGTDIDLGRLPQEPAVYDLLCAADTVGVFQVESRAQMGTLPRVRPRCFYDLVVEVALIRPGPIQGQAVNPYIRRRRHLEPVTYLHPLLEPILTRTLGVPLFQEQLMEMAVAIAGFSPAEADELRQAMAAKRSHARMAALRDRLYAGMAERDVVGERADTIFNALAAFANFGFPESHSVSFAHLVYASAWLKLHHPAAFCAGLLNSQPMGFWSPQSLVADAKRHGVVVRRPHVDRSAVGASLEPPGGGGQGRPVLRLGLAGIKGVGEATAGRIVAGAPWAGPEDLVRRAGLTRSHLEVLAASGALDPDVEPVAAGAAAGEAAGDERARSIGRRRRLWAAGAAAQGTPDRLPGIVVGTDAPALPVPGPLELVGDDLWSLGLTPGRTAMEVLRPDLDARGVVPADRLAAQGHGARVLVAGVVTHRQHPETARGAVFVNLEDETGHVNVVFSPGAWARWRRVARHAPVLVIAGRLEALQDVVNVTAERVEALGAASARLPVPASL